MLFGLRMLILVVLAGLFVFFIVLLRRQRLELKYCLIWLVALLGIAVFCVFPNLLDRLSHLLGITLPVNTLFLICIAFLACICVSLTVVVSSLANRVRKLTQDIAILEFEKKGKDRQ